MSWYRKLIPVAFWAAIGAAISIQGFALYRGFDFTGNSSTPDGVLMVVSPWEDEDLEVSTSPPIFGGVMGAHDEVWGDESVTISVGVAQYSGDRKALFTDADAALYRAKNAGRDCVMAAGLEG